MSGTVRGWIFTGCLLLSHGAVFWLGRALPPRGEGGKVPQVVKESPVAAAAARPSPQEWLSRGREREERAAKQEKDFPAEVEAARQRLAAGTEDVAAIVTTGMRSDARNVSAETAAAFGLWLEREPKAALHELERWLNRHEWGEGDPFGSEIGRFLERDGRLPLRDLIGAVPGVREFVHDAAVIKISERDAGLALRLLRELDDPKERMELFTRRFLEARQFSGHIAAIRREFDDAEADAFLSHFRYIEGVEALLPEIRAAGFPAAALASFEKDRAEAEAEAPEEVAQPDLDQLPLAEQIKARLAYLQVHWRLTGTFAAQLPDFYDWCEDAGDGRLAAEEIITRAKAAVPEAAGLDRELRMLAFGELVQTSPREGVLMLRGGGVNWPDECPDSLKVLPLEEMGDFLKEFPLEGSLSRELRSDLVNRFLNWHLSDPEACAKSIRGFPGSVLRDDLTKRILEEDGK